MSQPTFGVIGGTGFYSLLEDIEEKWVDTPYGSPSDQIAVGTYKNKRIAFLPRHGKHHHIPPHQINYRANLWALKGLGVKFIVAPAAVGSLQKNIRPGDFVVVDQYIDRTKKRIDTFYDGPTVTHMPCVTPFCPLLRKRSVESLLSKDVPHHSKGTVVVVEGPRFSSQAESKWFTKMDWDIVNMTLYPEAILARELEMCYSSIGLVTDYDSGFDGEFPPVNVEDAISVFRSNTETLKSVVLDIIDHSDDKRSCSCHNALDSARF